jgi:hypothetical protein
VHFAGDLHRHTDWNKLAVGVLSRLKTPSPDFFDSGAVKARAESLDEVNWLNHRPHAIVLELCRESDRRQIQHSQLCHSSYCAAVSTIADTPGSGAARTAEKSQ